MTTELVRPTRAPQPRISPIELRLYVVALLAAVHAITWRAIGGQHAAPEPAPTAAVAEPPPATPTAHPRLTAAPPRVVRSPSRPRATPVRRVVRVRTRSS